MNLVKFRKESDLMNDAFKSLFNSPFFSEDTMTKHFTPRTRITEDKDNFFIQMEMPGVTKEDVKITLENNLLSISGTKKNEKKTEDNTLIMNEIFYGEFSRSFTVSDDIKKDAIEADFKDGVLKLTLPKKEEVKPVVKEIKLK